MELDSTTHQKCINPKPVLCQRNSRRCTVWILRQSTHLALTSQVRMFISTPSTETRANSTTSMTLPKGYYNSNQHATPLHLLSTLNTTNNTGTSTTGENGGSRSSSIKPSLDDSSSECAGNSGSTYPPGLWFGCRCPYRVCRARSSNPKPHFALSEFEIAHFLLFFLSSPSTSQPT